MISLWTNIGFYNKKRVLLNPYLISIQYLWTVFPSLTISFSKIAPLFLDFIWIFLIEKGVFRSMFYFIYTMLGSLCIFFSCINLLPEKLFLSCRLLLLFWTLLSSQILNQLLGQYFVFITLPVILLILYHCTSFKCLCLSCSIFGYLFAVTFNYLCLSLIHISEPTRP